MGYVQQHLNKGESVVHLNTLHWIVFGWPVFWLVQSVMLGIAVEGTAVIASVIFLLAAMSILSRWIDLKTSEFAVTDTRIIMKTGLIRRRSVELNLAQVERVTIDQGAIGRLLNFGTVIVSGTGGTSNSFTWISHPMEFKSAVQEQSNSLHASEIGRHVAALKGASDPAQSAPSPTPRGDVVDGLERLGKLRADGILTDEEFNAQKARLLE